MFKVYFLENESLNRKMLFHIFDLFSHVKWPSADYLIPGSNILDKFSNSIFSKTKSRMTKFSSILLSYFLINNHIVLSFLIGPYRSPV